MAAQLKNPPLQEVVCEVQFAGDPAWNMMLPGLLHQALRDRFPASRQFVRPPEIPGRPTIAALEGATIPTMVQLMTEDQKLIVQTGPDRLTLNALGEGYQGWDSFKETLLEVWRIHHAQDASMRCQRVQLQYINMIDRTPGVKPDTVYTVLPVFPGVFPDPLTNFYQHHEFSTVGPIGMLSVTAASAQKDDRAVWLLDLRFGADEAATLQDWPNMASWLDGAHDQISAAFLASLTPSILETFE